MIVKPYKVVKTKQNSRIIEACSVLKILNIHKHKIVPHPYSAFQQDHFASLHYCTIHLQTCKTQ